MKVIVGGNREARIVSGALIAAAKSIATDKSIEPSHRDWHIDILRVINNNIISDSVSEAADNTPLKGQVSFWNIGEVEHG